MATPWLRIDEGIFDDARVMRAMQRHGPLGGVAWIYCLLTARRQEQAGRIEIPAALMARDLNAKETDCAQTTETLVEVGLIVRVEDDTYEVPRWVEYQPDDRSKAAQAKRKLLHPERKRGRPPRNDP